MGEEGPSPHLLAEVDQILVRPGWADVAVEPGIRSLRVPADAEAITVGLGLRLGGVQ